MKIQALATCPKVVIGKVMKFEPFTCDVEKRTLELEDVAQEDAFFEEVREKASVELDNLCDFLAGGNSSDADFVKAHKEILNDRMMNSEIKDLIRKKAYPADRAVAEVYDNYIKFLSNNPNPVIAQRAADLRDVRTRILRNYHGEPEKNLSMLASDCIIVADELFPTDTLCLDKEKVKGIVTQKGGLTSHTAIIAKTFDILAMLGAREIMDTVQDGDTIILDGVEAVIILNPSAETIREYEEKLIAVEQDLRVTSECYFQDAVTKDGVRIELRLNIASDHFGDEKSVAYLDGVGLYRSEFLYVDQPELPSEEIQFASYKNVTQAFGDKPVVLRTLDIGGDKHISYMPLPEEENPFLGNRGLRLCLCETDILRTQLRAALRASAYGNLEIMFPMVSSINEFRAAKTIVEECKKELDAEGLPYNDDVKIGIMIEVPSIAIVIDRIIDEIDFASIGTNDLVQYLCAADRMNEDVQEYYQNFHPSLFLLLSKLVDTFSAAGKCLSICGEMGGDPIAIPLLIGMGIRTLSMNNSSIAKAKQVIRSISAHEVMNLAKEVLEKDVSNLDVENRLNEYCKYLGKVMS